MSKSIQIQQFSPSVKDLIFADLALRDHRVSLESVQRGWSVLEELARAGIERSLPRVLVDHRMVDAQVARDVVGRVERVQIPCARCGEPALLGKLDRRARVSCERCASVLELTVDDSVQTRALEANPAVIDALRTVVICDSHASGLAGGRKSPGHRQGAMSAETRSAADGRDEVEERSSIGFNRFPARECIQRFRIDRVIHSGPHGRTYCARAREARRGESSRARTVVLKVLAPDLLTDARLAPRLASELQLWTASKSALNHPVHRLEEESGVYYYVRPYFQSPFVELSEVGELNLTARLRLILAIAAVVADIHRQGKVHGNLKPSNVFVDRQADFGRVALVDPGLHLLRPGDGLQRSQLLARAPRYVAPEEVDGKPPTLASDVYSLGWIFFSVLTGSVPFAGTSAAEILRRHREGPCPELKLAGWKDLVRQMTALSPGERPSNAVAVLEEVKALVGGKSIERPLVTPRPSQEHTPGAARASGGAFAKLRFALGPGALLLALSWVGWCYTRWSGIISVQGAQDRLEQLYSAAAEWSFESTRLAAASRPDHAEALWEEFLRQFSDSTLVEAARAEKKAGAVSKPPDSRGR